jgi:hypothetical protein
LGPHPVIADFRIDERMIAVLHAQTLCQPLRARGKIEPFLGQSE